MNKIVSTGPTFFSRGDEDSLFAWIKRIRSVVEVRGIGRELELYLDEGGVTDSDLKELIAVFIRYKMEAQQLSRLLSEANRSWFLDKRMFWHDPIFGEG